MADFKSQDMARRDQWWEVKPGWLVLSEDGIRFVGAGMRKQYEATWEEFEAFMASKHSERAIS